MRRMKTFVVLLVLGMILGVSVHSSLAADSKVLTDWCS